MVNVSHPTGNANVRAVLNGLLNNRLLSGFHTTISVFPGDTLDRISSFSFLSELKRRSYDISLKPFTKNYPWIELGRLIASKANLLSFLDHETGLVSIDAVYKSLDNKVASAIKKASFQKSTKGIYAYEDGALNSFRQGKQYGLQCFYDLPIGYWRTARKFLERERERWPDWIPTLTGFKDSEDKLNRKDEELRLADRIFVASKFTAATLKDYPGTLAPIEVIPYGFPAVCKTREYRSPTKRLKILFVGGLSQRKGIADLFAVAKKLENHVELTVVGQKGEEDCTALNVALNSHNWIPTLSHTQILQLMQQHDIFVFPSLFEGFGLVITEAMSQGTPVITTNRTAGQDLITEGQNGWLIEAGSTQALQNAIEYLLQNPTLIAKAGREAMETASHRSWEVYGQEMAEAIKRHFNGKKNY